MSVKLNSFFNFFQRPLPKPEPEDAELIPKNVRERINSVPVTAKTLRASYEKVSVGIEKGARLFDYELDQKMGALVQAEKTRIYFNNKNIPVAYTTQDFKGFVISSVLKQLHGNETKGLKVWSNQAETRDLRTNPEVNEYRENKPVLCASTHLFDSTHGESHIFYLKDNSYSESNCDEEAFLKDLQKLVGEEKGEEIYALYQTYKEKLTDINGAKLLYTIALTDIANHPDAFRFSERFAEPLREECQKGREDIHAAILECNKKSSIKEQNRDAPQLRLKKPSAGSDNGIRMFRCYQSAEQKRLHHEFKTAVASIIVRP